MLGEVKLYIHEPGCSFSVGVSQSSEDYLVLITDFKRSWRVVDSKGRELKLGIDRVSDTEQFEKRVMGWMRSVVTGSGGSSDLNLIKRMSDQSISYWWLIEPTLFRNSVKRYVRYAIAFKKLVNEIEPYSVCVLPSARKYSNIIRSVCEDKKIPVEELAGLKVILRELFVGFVGYVKVISWFQLLKVRSRIRGLLLPKPAIKDSSILLASMYRDVKTLNAQENKLVSEEFILAPIIEELQATVSWPLVYLYKYGAPRQVRVPKIFLGQRYSTVSWETWYTRGTKEQWLKLVAQQRKVLASCIRHTDFRLRWCYEGIDISNQISADLDGISKKELVIACMYRVLSLEIVKSNKIKTLVVASETSLDNKALVVAAKEKKIPVVAIQHGNIIARDDYLCDFTASKEDMNSYAGKRHFFPDKFCLFGDQVKTILLNEMSYPAPKALQVTGQARFDQLIKLSHSSSYKSAATYFKLDFDRPVILLASQTFNLQGDRGSFLNAVFKSLASLEGVQLAIKPHPIEDPKDIRRRLRNAGCGGVVLPASLLFADALKFSDLVITSYSTVAVEAMLARRPVITVNFSGEPDLVPYANRGAAKGVYCIEDLNGTLSEIVFNSEERDKLIDRASQYVRDEFFECDGNAAARNVKVIRDQYVGRNPN